MNRPSLSVITAVYGNADTIEELWMRVAQTLEAAAIPFELIFVDDACPGGSGAVIARTARRDARVRVVTHPANLGQDRALLSGLRVCTGDAAVLIDADLQDLPEVIPLMAEHLAKTQSDAVFADRTGHYESYARLATSRIYRWLLARLTRLPPHACLFVMMNRRVIDGLLAQPPACPWLLPRLGQVVGVPGSLPFERSPRPVGCSAHTMWRRIHKGASSLLWAVALRGSRECHDR
jgi:glycosyltransferase involved in cell wall biosynthesis